MCSVPQRLFRTPWFSLAHHYTSFSVDGAAHRIARRFAGIIFLG